MTCRSARSDVRSHTTPQLASSTSLRLPRWGWVGFSILCIGGSYFAPAVTSAVLMGFAIMAATRRVDSSWDCAISGVLFFCALQAGGNMLHHVLRYERAQLMAGQELWRIVTAHGVHLGWFHVLLNACGLLLCCVLAPDRFRPRRLVFDVLFLATAISLLLAVFSPQVSDYVGFSGVLYGLLVLGLIPSAVRGNFASGGALLITVGWMAWQCLVGPSRTEEQQIGGHIIVDAHLYGVTAAVALLLCEAVSRRCRQGSKL